MQMHASTGCVLMASGLSTRFGSNKLLAQFDGQPLLCRAFAAAKKPVLGTVIGALGALLSFVLSGVFVWGEYMPETFFGMTMTSPWIYSALYNGSFLLLSLAMVLVVIAILQKPLGKYLRGDDLKK